MKKIEILKVKLKNLEESNALLHTENSKWQHLYNRVQSQLDNINFENAYKPLYSF